MKIGIMQPYLFPYIGYWQLINLVDKFVILDDVNYIMRGFINRNSILVNGKPYRFTIPIRKASQNKLIMETKLSFSLQEKQKLLKTFCNAYQNTPYFENVMPILENIILSKEEDLTQYIYKSLKDISEYLQISTEFYFSSRIQKNSDLCGEERILEICKKLGGNEYINLSGGRKLYHQDSFVRENIKLYFLDTNMDKIVYDQNQDYFEKSLSIIDVLFFNDIGTIKSFLRECVMNPF